MKKATAIVALLGATVIPCLSQQKKAFYLGYENGPKWDIYHYSNNHSLDKDFFCLDGLWGINAGFEFKYYDIEMNFSGNYSSSPAIDYNISNNTAERSFGSHGSSVDSWQVSLRLKGNFSNRRDIIAWKPMIGISVMMARSMEDGYSQYGNEVESVSKGLNKFNPVVEAGASFRVRVIRLVDLELKSYYYAALFSPYVEHIRYESGEETIYAQKTHTGQSLNLLIGANISLTRFFALKIFR